MFYLYIIYNVPRLPRQMFHVEHFDWGGTFFKRSAQIIIATGVIQAMIAICQFVIQHSIGLTWLRESDIGANIPGVAKLILDSHKIIRSYGLFPHPNILGGFLLISIILTWSYHKLFHVEQFGQTRIKSKINTLLIIQLIGLILTFSKSAILGLAITAIYINIKNNVPRGTFNFKKSLGMFHVEHFSRRLILTLGIILALGYIIRPNINSALFKSLNERLLYLNVSRGTILAQPLIGVGFGQFVLNMDEYAPRLPAGRQVEPTLESWQYQPVHNVFMLIWSELGIIGLGLFTWWLWQLFHACLSGRQVEQKYLKPDVECSTWNNDHCEAFAPTHEPIVPRGTILAQQKTLHILRGALLGLIFIMLLDHYLWDIQQGEVLFWIAAGLIAGMVRMNSIDK
ncbi:MAG: O-antigen ligase family protein [Parcubacteria group bacterium]